MSYDYFYHAGGWVILDKRGREIGHLTELEPAKQFVEIMNLLDQGGKYMTPTDIDHFTDQIADLTDQVREAERDTEKAEEKAWEFEKKLSAIAELLDS